MVVKCNVDHHGTLRQKHQTVQKRSVETLIYLLLHIPGPIVVVVVVGVVVVVVVVGVVVVIVVVGVVVVVVVVGVVVVVCVVVVVTVVVVVIVSAAVGNGESVSKGVKGKHVLIQQFLALIVAVFCLQSENFRGQNTLWCYMVS